MTDQELSIAELEDKPDTVYVFGVASEQPPSIHEWMNDDEGFHALWDKKFDHAEAMAVPGVTGITEVQQTTKEKIEAMLESVDRDNDSS